MKCNCLFTIRNQQGAALLAFVLVMLVGSSFLMLSKLNAKISDSDNVVQTYDSLQRAKDALIAFSLTVPERNPGRGPGYLPCPDNDNDGDAEPACGGGGVSVGRIPYETLEEDVLTDSSGEVIWYILAQNYRNIGAAFTPLNSDTPSDPLLANRFILDGNAAGPDVVAILIAPGSALSGQNRLGAGINAIANYLDLDNNDLDVNYISNSPGNLANFNDKVVTLTRQELMAAVEKRVLGDISNSLETYRRDPDKDDFDINGFDDDGDGNLLDDDNACAGPAFDCDNAYPWLYPFTDPTVNPGTDWFAGDAAPALAADVNRGLLGMHINGQPYSNNNGLTANWVLPNPGGGAVTNGATPPLDICYVNWNCANQYGFNGIIVNNASCIWTNPLSIDCTITDDATNAGVGITRTYRIQYQDDGSSLTIDPPAVGFYRQRNFNINGALANALTVTITDTNTVGGAFVGDSQFTYPAGTVIANLTITGIDYHLDPIGADINGDGDFNDPNEIAPDIPAWIETNNWHHLAYIAYPIAEALPGSNAPCPAPCITVQAPGSIAANVRAIAMTAGQVIPLLPLNQNRVGSNNEADYFDIGENNNQDDIFSFQAISRNNNDQIRIVNP